MWGAQKITGRLAGKRGIIVIVLLSFLLSLSYSFYFRIRPAVDAAAYDIIAINLVEGKGYRENPEKDIKYDNAIIRVGPLYELFLAGIYKAFGHHYELVWVAQAAMHAVSVWLIYLICVFGLKGRECKNKVALWAAGIFGFYPDLIEISAMLMSETFYLFLFCLMLYLFFRNFNRDSALSFLFLGLATGLSVLTRPPVLFLVPIIIFYFYRRQKLCFIALFCFLLFLVLLPWSVRNYVVYHRIMPLGAAGTYNFWIGNHYGANGEQEQPQEAIEFIEQNGVSELPEESIRQAKNFILSHPLEFVKLTALRVNKYFSIIRPMGFWFYLRGWGQFLFLASSALASIILFIFGFGGMIRSIKLKNDAINYLLSFTIATPLIIFLTVVETRYRFQIYPLLAVFAGYFIVSLLSVEKWWKNRTFQLSALAIVLNGAVDLLLSIERLKERIGWFF